MNNTQKTLIKISIIFNFVMAGFALIYTLIFGVYAVAMRLMLADTSLFQDAYSNMYQMYGMYDESMIDMMTGFMSNFMFIYILIFAVIALSFAVGLVLQGIFLIQKKNYTFCMVMAVVSTLIPVFGTAPGVMTLIALSHPEGKALFQKTPPMMVPPLPVQS